MAELCEAFSLPTQRKKPGRHNRVCRVLVYNLIYLSAGHYRYCFRVSTLVRASQGRSRSGRPKWP